MAVVNSPPPAPTPLQRRLGHLYLPLLLAHVQQVLGQGGRVKQRLPVRYKFLVEWLRQANSLDPDSASATPIGIGMPLYVVYLQCQQYGWPNLAALGVNGMGVPGESFTGDWEADLEAIIDFDWDSAAAAPEVAQIADAAASAGACKPAGDSSPKKGKLRRLHEDTARDLYWQAYQAERAKYDGVVTLEDKEAMIKLIRLGMSPEEAFAEIIV